MNTASRSSAVAKAGVTAFVLLCGASISTAQTTGTNQSTPRQSPGGTYNNPSATSSANNPDVSPRPSAVTPASNVDYSATDRMNSDNKLGWRERRFVAKTADGGHDEVELAKLATQKASNPDVRAFAERLVADHTAVNEELAGIATSKNVKIDKDDDQSRTYRRLSKKSGEEFDREFIEHMVESHEDGIQRFEKAAKDAKDAEIRSFASKHIDHLRQHLQQAERLQQSTMPTGRLDSNVRNIPADGAVINSGYPSSTTPNASAPSSSTARPATESTNTGGQKPNSPNDSKRY